jgi:hypothetical protein
MTDLDSRPAPPGRFHWGRVVSLAGAAGLCVSFFIPQIDFIGPSPISPAEFAMVSDFVGMVGISLPYFAATLLLPLVAFRTLPRMDSIPGAGKVLAWAVCAISMAVLIINLSWISCVIVSDVLSRTIIAPVAYAVPAVTVLSLVLAIVAMVRSRLPRKAAAAQFALGATCLAYFAFFAIADFTKYAGLWLSLAASGMLAIGSAIDWFQCRPGLNR